MAPILYCHNFQNKALINCLFKSNMVLTYIRIISWFYEGWLPNTFNASVDNKTFTGALSESYLKHLILFKRYVYVFFNHCFSCESIVNENYPKFSQSKSQKLTPVWYSILRSLFDGSGILLCGKNGSLSGLLKWISPEGLKASSGVLITPRTPQSAHASSKGVNTCMFASQVHNK